MIARLALALLMAVAPATARAAPPAFGTWMTDDRAAVVRIGPCSGKLCGAIEQVLDPAAPEHDINNPDRALRKRPLAGTVILYGFAPSGAAWTGGRAYDPKSGRTYRADLRVAADGRLKVTGCVLFVCRSRYWTRR